MTTGRLPRNMLIDDGRETFWHATANGLATIAPLRQFRMRAEGQASAKLLRQSFEGGLVELAQTIRSKFRD